MRYQSCTERAETIIITPHVGAPVYTYSGRGFIYFGASRSLMVRSATLPILHSRTTEIMFGASGYKSRRERQCNLSRALRVWLMCARAPSIALMFYARRGWETADFLIRSSMHRARGCARQILMRCWKSTARYLICNKFQPRFTAKYLIGAAGCLVN
jgi:hypothetical protein